MIALNDCMLAGYLQADPSPLKEFQRGDRKGCHTRFNLIVPNGGPEQGALGEFQKNKTSMLICIAFNDVAKAMVEYCKKGDALIMAAYASGGPQKGRNGGYNSYACTMVVRWWKHQHTIEEREARRRKTALNDAVSEKTRDDLPFGKGFEWGG